MSQRIINSQSYNAAICILIANLGLLFNITDCIMLKGADFVFAQRTCDGIMQPCFAYAAD